MAAPSGRLIVSKFIHDFERATNIFNVIPPEIHQLCQLFYIIPKPIFIRFPSKKISKDHYSQTIFKMINPVTRFISKSIILKLPNSCAIIYSSCRYISDIFKRLTNIAPDTINSLDVKLEDTHKSYDAFFCIIKQKSNYLPSFVIFESTYIYNQSNQTNINAKVWISNHSIRRTNNIRYRDLYPNDEELGIFKQLYPFSVNLHKNNITIQLKQKYFVTMNMKDITNADTFKFKRHKLKILHPKESTFTPQPTVSYEEALDELLHGNCCIGVYDKEVTDWRPALYEYQFDKKQTILLRYASHWIKPKKQHIPCFIDDIQYDSQLRFMQKFPSNSVKLKGFYVKKLDLTTNSNLSTAAIDEYIKRRNSNSAIIKREEHDPLGFGEIRLHALCQKNYRYICSDGINLICFWNERFYEIYDRNQNRFIHILELFTDNRDWEIRKDLLWFDKHGDNTLYAAIIMSKYHEKNKNHVPLESKQA